MSVRIDVWYQTVDSDQEVHLHLEPKVDFGEHV